MFAVKIISTLFLNAGIKEHAKELGFVNYW